MSDPFYQEILSLAKQSSLTSVTCKGCVYTFELVKDERLFPYSGKTFVVDIGVDKNPWAEGWWMTKTIFRQEEDGTLKMVSHGDGAFEEKPAITQQMAVDELTTYLYCVLKKEKKNEK